jgi:FMN phosphatase YigB (HAD superfamily)
MNIVFDMDNTLTDEFGKKIRPGMVDLLSQLKDEGHTLTLWTNSTRTRALKIIQYHNLKQYFSKCIFREDYDKHNEGLNKDIRKIHADILIDDDPDEISYTRRMGKTGILIQPFRSTSTPDEDELGAIYKTIKKKTKFFHRLLP